MTEFSPAMEAALNDIQRLLDQGWEFPDASAKVAVKTGFGSDEITRSYDIRCTESAKRAA